MKWRLLFLLFSLLLVASGCGTVTVAEGTPLPTTLQVERATHTINDFAPFSRTVISVAKVQTLYNTALALPEPSTGPARSCPADYELIYHLSFLQNGTLIQQMVLDASGCDYLIVGKSDMRATSNAFIALFAQTMGVSQSQVVVGPLPRKSKPAP